MTIFRSIPIVLYYRQTPEGDKVPTNVIASTPGPPTRDIQLNSETSDWLKVRGDKDRAPIQRTFGDYITLTSDGKRLAAAWTDGRSGEARIYTRIFKMP